MRCYICDVSDNLDGAEIKVDKHTGRMMCRSCWESFYDAMDEFFQEDESDATDDSSGEQG